MVEGLQDLFGAHDGRLFRVLLEHPLLLLDSSQSTLELLASFKEIFFQLLQVSVRIFFFLFFIVLILDSSDVVLYFIMIFVNWGLVIEVFIHVIYVMLGTLVVRFKGTPGRMLDHLTTFFIITLT